jgi:anti-anti-sigma factor
VLNITIESARRVVTVRCQGRLVFGLESALFGAAVPLHMRDVIILDLSGVTAIDAAGIGALTSLRAAGTYLRLVDPSETVRQVLRLTNLHSVFDISGSECRKRGLERLLVDQSDGCLCGTSRMNRRSLLQKNSRRYN